MNKDLYPSDLRRTQDAARKGAPSFSLKYQVVQGRAVGPGAYFNQEEALLAGDGSLQVFRRRALGENALPAPGRFEGRLSPAEIEALLANLAGVEAWTPPAQTPAPTDEYFRLALVLDGSPHALSWGPLAPEERLPRAETLQALADLLNHASLRPVWSLRLEVRDQKKAGAETQWTLALINEGRAPITCVHPGAPLGWAPLQVTAADMPEALPGVTPLPPEPEFLEALTPAVPAPWLLPLSPGAALEFRASAPVSPGARVRAKLSYAQWALPEAFAGQSVFQGEVFSEEISC